MAKFTQQFFQPGWWNVGGIPRRFTKGELSERCANTDRFIQSNPAGGIPLFPAHKPAGSQEGGPRLSDRDSRDCTGWLHGVSMDSDGKCFLQVDVGDPRTAEGIENKTIRFTSPEMSGGDYVDSKGKNWGPMFRHIATTASPRNREQGPITPMQFSEGCIQFSEDDFMGTTKKAAAEKAAQFADDQFKKKADETAQVAEAIDESADESTDVSPTSPNADELATNDTEVEVANEHPDQQTLNSLVVKIQEIMGIELPENADAIAVLTAILNMAKAKKEAAAELSGDIELTEEPNVAQFSEEATAMIDALKEQNATMKAEKAVALHSKNLAGVNAAIATAKIPKRLRTRLAERANALQFSEEGKEEPTITIKEAIALFEECIPASITQFAEGDVAEDEHPEGDDFFKEEVSKDETAKQAGKAADEQLARAGIKISKPQAVFQNTDLFSHGQGDVATLERPSKPIHAPRGSAKTAT